MKLRSGPVALVLLALAATALFIDVAQVDGGAVRSSRGTIEANDAGVVHFNQQRAGPGDVIEVWPERMVHGPFGEYRLVIVPGGQGEAYLAGATADTIWLSIDDLHVDRCCATEPVHFQRPNGGDPEYVDMVWIFDYDETTTRPAGEARTYFDAWVEGAITAAGETPGGGSTVVLTAAAARLHTILITVAVIAALGGGAAAIVWGLDRPLAVDATLVDLATMGRLHLQRLRDLLLVLIGPLILAGFLLEAGLVNLLDQMTGPGAAWEATILWTARGIWAVVLVVWLMQTRRVHQRMRRWNEVPAL